MAAVALPALVKTRQRVGGFRLGPWRLGSRPLYRASAWRYASPTIDGLVIEIPDGFLTDLVSAPWWARPFMPLRALAVAALIHDWLRRMAPHLPLEVIDALMLLAMIEIGVPEPWRTIVWLAVRTNNNRA